MLIYIIRHGETDANAAQVVQGQTDYPLNDNGRALAELTGRAMQGIHFDACISSPLLRAKETAEILLRESGNCLPIQTDNRIMEISFGDYENTSIFQDTVVPLFTDPLHTAPFPNGESAGMVCARTQAFLNDLIRRDDGKTYLISTHGCALRAMLNKYYEDPSDYWHGHVPYNCAVSVLEAEDGKGKLIVDDRIYYDHNLIVDRYRFSSAD